VIEKEPDLGGLARAGTDGTLSFGQGAAYSLYPYNDGLNALYEDLGIVTGYGTGGEPLVDPTYLVKAPCNNDYVHDAWIVDSWGAGMDDLPYSAQIISDLKAFRQRMLDMYDYVGADGRLGFDTPSDASTTDAEIRALDGMSLLDYVTSNGWHPAVSFFFDPYCRSSLGCTHDTVSAWAAICFLGGEFSPVLSQPGGNAYLAQKLVDKIGRDRFLTSALTLLASETDGEVHVSTLEGGVPATRRAKTLVYAAPRFMANYLLPGLTAAGRKEYKAFDYRPFIVANAHVSQTPARLGYDNWLQGDYAMTDLIVADWAGLASPTQAPLTRPNVLTIYSPLFGPTARADLQTNPFELYERKLLDDLEKAMPGVTDVITGFDIYRWGHAMVSPTKGFVFGADRVGAQAPLGRISFACTDVDGLPAFENAVAAGYRGANEAMTQLGI
jgi:hypothetical protein